MQQNLKLNIKQLHAVQLIAHGWTRGQVAAELSVDPATLSRWRQLPSFQQDLIRLLDQSERETVESFRAIKLIAVERLTTLLQSKKEGVALRAIAMVLSKTDLTFANLPDPMKMRQDAQWNQILEDLLHE